MSSSRISGKTLKNGQVAYENFFFLEKTKKIIFHINEANFNLPGGRWRLILEASQVQI
jgi:hypothetical protein